MKKLLLIRHAKSDWNDPKLSDFDRPLNNRGHKNAPEMAERLLQKHIVPEHLVSSPAKRAYTTAKYFAKTFNIDKEQIEKIEGIYEASANDLLKIVNQLDNTKDFIALFGHNPGITNLAVGLSGSYISNIPTCGLILIEFPFDDWAMISYDTGKELLYDFPKSGDD
ncbi:SixA phosphatase family protein [Desertivirga brevis]|uniref:SixA phosphatase family protein n=1 Tax=Desertivirga brevis TaxID=2810310 RepID=UPI001A97AAA4|nr:histidine phosphatase family protein [Pedobacter sp. SYSU D00873]